MITFDKCSVYGAKEAIRGMRNPLNSWDSSDSYLLRYDDQMTDIALSANHGDILCIGEKDLDLAKRLMSAGDDHGKFLRMIAVYVDITAPMYWWSEYDTYKVGTVANSTSKMHKMMSKEFSVDDFSFDKVIGNDSFIQGVMDEYYVTAVPIVDELNYLRKCYLNTDNADDKKSIWYTVLQLLPASYNQTRTVMLNYQVLRHMYHARKNHKLDEWHKFCEWVESLPYAKELIIGED